MGKHSVVQEKKAIRQIVVVANVQEFAALLKPLSKLGLSMSHAEVMPRSHDARVLVIQVLSPGQEAQVGRYQLHRYPSPLAVIVAEGADERQLEQFCSALEIKFFRSVEDRAALALELDIARTILSQLHHIPKN